MGAALLCAAGAHAQSSVQLTGLVDVFAGSMKMAGDASSKSVVDSGGLTTSWFGMKGTEDLGGGLKAHFNLTSFIKRSELARDRSEQRPERFSVGQKVDVRVTQFDRRARKVQVSIKALEVAEEKEAIAQYGSSDSGATLGDILGTALKRAGEKKE